MKILFELKIIKKICVSLLLTFILLVSSNTVFLGSDFEDDDEDIAQSDIISEDFASSAKDSAAREDLVKADEYFNKAFNASMQGDYKTTRAYYHKLLRQLDSIDVEPSISSFLLTDCENMLKKLKSVYEMDTKRTAVVAKKLTRISLDYDKEILDKWINIYTTGSSRERIKLALERSERYKHIIAPILKEYNIPEELIYLPIVESLYNNNTVSSAKAVGIWQIMSHRGQSLGLQINYWIDERKDPVKATRAAAKYLKELSLLLNDWHLALSGYNRGEYGLIRDMKFSNASNPVEMRQRNAIPKETQNYIPQIIVAIMIGQNPEKYGFTDLNYQMPLKYDVVAIDKVIDLKIVAKCAGTTVEQIQELNPAINAWCTPQGYKNFELKIPLGTKSAFIDNIKKEKELNPSPGFIKHKVKKGEWLEKIAVRYKTTVKNINKDNPVLAKQKYLRPNQVVVVRPGKRYYDSK